MLNLIKTCWCLVSDYINSFFVDIWLEVTENLIPKINFILFFLFAREDYMLKLFSPRASNQFSLLFSMSKSFQFQVNNFVKQLDNLRINLWEFFDDTMFTKKKLANSRLAVSDYFKGDYYIDIKDNEYSPSIHLRSKKSSSINVIS